MSNGITVQMVGLSRRMKERVLPEREKRDRDRTLRGKARRRARRAA